MQVMQALTQKLKNHFGYISKDKKKKKSQQLDMNSAMLLFKIEITTRFHSANNDST